MMHIKVQNVKNYMVREKLVRRGESILVGVSGGADSMCLIDILQRVNLDLKLSVAHFNHCLRGQESDRDEQFVREYCNEMDIPCFYERGDVSAAAKRLGKGIEETARELRYAFFRRTKDLAGAAKIATAHNADDNVETVLMNMLRGTGMDGLCGIPPEREGIIRPILCLTKSEIEQYLQQAGVSHIFDSTNLDQRYIRNRLRHMVLPVLRDINPDTAHSVLSMTEALRRDKICLGDMAKEAFERIMEADTDGLRGQVQWLSVLPPALLSRVIILSMEHMGVSAEMRTIRAVEDIVLGKSPSAEVKLKGGVTAGRRYGELVFSRNISGGGFEPKILEIGARTDIDELGFVIYCSNKKINTQSLNTFYFKSSAICGNISVRPRLAGDKITLKGRGCTKTLKKLFIEERIPLADRQSVPVFADDEGVIGVMGLGIAERCAPEDGDDIIAVAVCDAPE